MTPGESRADFYDAIDKLRQGQNDDDVVHTLENAYAELEVKLAEATELAQPQYSRTAAYDDGYKTAWKDALDTAARLVENANPPDRTDDPYQEGLAKLLREFKEKQP